MAAITRDQAEQAMKASRKAAFQRFMDQPVTRMMVSMVPPTPNNPELLETLLEATFERGFGVGTAEVSLMLIGRMVEGTKPPSSD